MRWLRWHTLTSNIYADLLLNNVTGIPGTQGFGSSSNGGTFGINLLQYNPTTLTTTRLLGTTLNAGAIWYDSTSHSVGFSGVVNSIVEQHLPASLQLNTADSLTFAFSSADVTSITTNPTNGNLTGFTAFGTGDFNGTDSSPEPSTMTLSSVGVLGLIWLGWRKKRYALSAGDLTQEVPFTMCVTGRQARRNHGFAIFIPVLRCSAAIPVVCSFLTP